MSRLEELTFPVDDPAPPLDRPARIRRPLRCTKNHRNRRRSRAAADKELFPFDDPHQTYHDPIPQSQLIRRTVLNFLSLPLTYSAWIRFDTLHSPPALEAHSFSPCLDHLDTHIHTHPLSYLLAQASLCPWFVCFLSYMLCNKQTLLPFHTNLRNGSN